MAPNVCPHDISPTDNLGIIVVPLLCMCTNIYLACSFLDTRNHSGNSHVHQNKYLAIVYIANEVRHIRIPILCNNIGNWINTPQMICYSKALSTISKQDITLGTYIIYYRIRST